MKIGNIVWIKQTKRGVYMKKESENTEYKHALPDISARCLPPVAVFQFHFQPVRLAPARRKVEDRRN